MIILTAPRAALAALWLHEGDGSRNTHGSGLLTMPLGCRVVLRLLSASSILFGGTMGQGLGHPCLLERPPCALWSIQTAHRIVGTRSYPDPEKHRGSLQPLLSQIWCCFNHGQPDFLSRNNDEVVLFALLPSLTPFQHGLGCISPARGIWAAVVSSLPLSLSLLYICWQNSLAIDETLNILGMHLHLKEGNKICMTRPNSDSQAGSRLSVIALSCSEFLSLS